MAATKSERTRARIIEAAVAHFSATGYQAGSVAAVARDAGVSPGAVFAYFKSKDDLYLAAAAHDLSATIDAADEATAEAALPWLAFIQELVTSFETHQLPVRLLTEGPPHLSGQILDLEPLRRISVRLREDLAAARGEGLVRDDIDLDLIATGIETISLALLTSRYVNGISLQPHRRIGVAAVLLAATTPPGVPPRPLGPRKHRQNKARRGPQPQDRQTG